LDSFLDLDLNIFVKIRYSLDNKKERVKTTFNILNEKRNSKISIVDYWMETRIN
jgi:hypothetical protein